MISSDEVVREEIRRAWSRVRDSRSASERFVWLRVVERLYLLSPRIEPAERLALSGAVG